MTGLERATALLALLKDAACSGAPCPADSDLTERLDCTEEQVCDAFAFLSAAGFIECQRVVSIREAAHDLSEAA